MISPGGIGKGQVGICIGVYIAAKTIRGVGLGDNRGPVGNDPNATFRVQVQIVVTPKTGSVSSSTTPGFSSTAFLGAGELGTASTKPIKPTTDQQGTVHFKVSTTATNGLSGLPFAPKESIDMQVPIAVTQDGRVGIDPGGVRDGYPSIEVYSYSPDGTVTPVLQINETGNDQDLAPPMEQKIPPVPPPPPCPTNNCPPSPKSDRPISNAPYRNSQ